MLTSYPPCSVEVKEWVELHLCNPYMPPWGGQVHICHYLYVVFYRCVCHKFADVSEECTVPSWSLKTEAERSFETSVNSYHFLRRHIPKGSILIDFFTLSVWLLNANLYLSLTHHLLITESVASLPSSPQKLVKLKYTSLHQSEWRHSLP